MVHTRSCRVSVRVLLALGLVHFPSDAWVLSGQRPLGLPFLRLCIWKSSHLGNSDLKVPFAQKGMIGAHFTFCFDSFSALLCFPFDRKKAPWSMTGAKHTLFYVLRSLVVISEQGEMIDKHVWVLYSSAVSPDWALCS